MNRTYAAYNAVFRTMLPNILETGLYPDVSVIFVITSKAQHGKANVGHFTVVECIRTFRPIHRKTWLPVSTYVDPVFMTYIFRNPPIFHVNLYVISAFLGIAYSKTIK